MDKNFKLFVIIAIVFLGIAIAASTFFVLKSVGKDKQTVAADGKNAVNLTPIDLGEAIATNIFDESGEQHIARVVVSFGVDESSKDYKKFKEDFDTKKVVVRDEIIHILREQTYEMMSKADAQTKLGDEIAARTNKVLNTKIIGKVYFGDFFVQ